MRDATPPDYRRVKVKALQALARGGDVAAVRELERRGVDGVAVLDVTALADAALRALVRAWNDGIMPADRERSRGLAEAAQAELEVRFRVDQKLERGPVPPPPPPWLWPSPPRCVSWTRPTRSTLYPGRS